MILEENEALARSLEPRFRATWITLTVYSDLEAVGLTAAVAGALADRGISCNVVAAVDTTMCSCRCRRRRGARSPGSPLEKRDFPTRTQGAKSRNWV